jgi:hypothetical protein
MKDRRCYPAVLLFCAPTGIRTLVLALKGLRPGPLDDGGMRLLSGGILPLLSSRVKEKYQISKVAGQICCLQVK